MGADVLKSSRRYELLDLALERGVIPDAVLRAGSLYGAGAPRIARRRGKHPDVRLT